MRRRCFPCLNGLLLIQDIELSIIAVGNTFAVLLFTT